jgi:UDP:flavonoid glycosyltransferase YjiC (YdhE family)
LLDVVGDRLVSRHLNPIRVSLGLRPIRRLFTNWLSRDLVLGMFPDWYGPPQEDWPAQIRLVGFPLFDGNKEGELAPELVEFCKADSPPLVFTFGTGMMHAARLFDSAIDACKLLGRHAVFLTRYTEQLPAALPPFIHHCEFASFDQLFPRCAAVIHHGGVGTAAQALAAGIPQLAIPFAFDQTDNGVRVKGLGCGDWLKGRQRGGRSIANAISRITDSTTTERCRRISEKFKQGEPLAAAADLIEQLSNRTVVSKRSAAKF